ncbi:copia protein [Tanacetum coccineum]
MTIIGTKWVFRNKLDKNGIVSRNKARLVAQGYNQQEGIDYDETYALVAKLESIRILLAYACALDFKLFQMDVKSTFLNGFINEEVPHPLLALSLQGAQAQECTLVHDPPAPWDQVHTLENMVPALATVWQPPRKDPQMGYSMIVPQSEQKYRSKLVTSNYVRDIIIKRSVVTYEELGHFNRIIQQLVVNATRKRPQSL